MIRESLVPLETVERYGPLAVGLQTQAAIALDQAGRNGLLSRVEAGELESSWLQVRQRTSDTLRKDASERFPFVREGRRLAMKPSGHLSVTTDTELKKWLQQTSESVCDVEGEPLARPMTIRGDLNMVPSLWSEHARCEPSIKAWIDLCAAADLKRDLAPVGPGRARGINPSYEVVPRIRAIRPSLEPIVDYERIQTFGPARGDFLIVGTLPDLKLRCLAELCERNSLSVRLAALFRDGIDPTHVAASCWLGHALDLQSLDRCREASPREYEIAMTTARVFLDAMVHAWAVQIPIRILKETHHIPFDVRQAKRYLSELKGHVFPEVGVLFAAEGVPSPVGRLRGGMPSRAQAWSAACLDLADDVMKVIHFALFDAGYDLVGCTGDQFVLEGRRGTSRGSEVDSELIPRIDELVKDAAGGLLEHVPVSCKIVPAENWRPGRVSVS